MTKIDFDDSFGSATKVTGSVVIDAELSDPTAKGALEAAFNLTAAGITRWILDGQDAGGLDKMCQALANCCLEKNPGPKDLAAVKAHVWSNLCQYYRLCPANTSAQGAECAVCSMCSYPMSFELDPHPLYCPGCGRRIVKII